MLTFVEAISLAGDRAKQNDDAYGVRGNRAWVLDGATDLHTAPLSGAASDAAWIANIASRYFHQAEGLPRQLRPLVAGASASANAAFSFVSDGVNMERWQSPIASLLMIEAADDIEGLDLGDCRLFALGADSATHIVGGPEDAADEETKSAASQTDADKPLLERRDTVARLRAARATLNRPGAQWTFSLDPACANHARTWSFRLARPAHLLLMTDGFSALTDRYKAYDAASLVRAALDRGLQELGRELRTIENADEAGDKHPRFKKSDDATALLMRLT